MSLRRVVVAVVCVSCLAIPAVTRGQTLLPPPAPLPASGPHQAPPAASSFWAPFKAIPKDFTNFFSPETARILGATSVAALVAHRWDDEGMAMALDHFTPVRNFQPGNVAGGAVAQVGGSFVAYAVGRATGSPRVAAVGGDLLRAQILTQGIVQTMKHTLHRTRPDGSNNYSMPSGHTAGTMATATVLQRHFGWKVGIPAYALGAYVATSRMSANKHHLTDVIIGSAIGVATGRTVTVGRGKSRFALGIAPTNGGAAITFTKQ